MEGSVYPRFIDSASQLCSDGGFTSQQQFHFFHIFAEGFFFFFAEKPLRRASAYTFGQLKQILQLAATFPNISISTAVISIEEPPL